MYSFLQRRPLPPKPTPPVTLSVAFWAQMINIVQLRVPLLPALVAGYR